jgi:rhodanese-related sulfurtransferase
MKQDMQPKELHAKLHAGELLRIIDVRSPSEFASGHVPGAVNVPLATIHDSIPGIAPEEAVVLVCQGGVRSQSACEKVLQNHQKLYNLVGGTSAWVAAGLEVETSPKATRSLDRQTHLVAGLLLVTAFILFRSVNAAWIYLALLPTFGLMLDALTGVCPMTLILKKMPWNASREATA